MLTAEFFQRIPKVELHVHLEGSVRPETVLKLAKRHGIRLPADTVEDVRKWYEFRDFRHFVEIYLAVTKCIKTAEDIELVVREFLEGQAAQNILHSEVTFTASTFADHVGVPWPGQHAALLRAMRYGREELGVSMGLVLDIVRGCTVERAVEVAEWATESEGVVALGLAGEEYRGRLSTRPRLPSRRATACRSSPMRGRRWGRRASGRCWSTRTRARIGHGVRCVEDPKLVRELADRQIPLEVCPTSNVALGVYPSLGEHPLPRLLDEGLYVTVNSDDPPMFGTTLSEEFERCAAAFEFDQDIVWSLCLNAARASLLPEDGKRELILRMREEFSEVGME